MGNMPSVMSHNFSQVPRADIPRSSFNRSHGFKTTFDAGYLVPIFCDEVLPGDSFNLRMASFARLATPIVPVMDNMYFDTFFFFVPNRLLWTNWEKFNGAQTDPDDSTTFLLPLMTSTAVTGYTVGTLYDFFGLPTDIPGFNHCSLPMRAYNLIWNEWFRDQNLQDSVVVDTDDGPDAPTDYVVLKRGKRHDYFTSCLPWPQKGPAVTLPLGTRAPVRGIGKLNTTYPTAAQDVYETDQASQVQYANSAVIDNTTNSHFYVEEGITGTAGLNDRPNIWADLSAATASTINALRQSFQIQKLYERDARGGTRYTEIIRSHFGVISPDARLQRPEFLGGNSTPISVSPIAQTSGTDESVTPDFPTPQGNLAAMGTMSQTSAGFSKSFTEHGFIIGLCNVRADLNYQQGLNRMWSRRSRWDFYWPALAHIGEQAVLNQEIYCQGTGNPTEDADVFGYQERYAEYRYKPSVITGQFRSTFATSLDIWHLAQDFTALPQLDEDFIQDDPPIDRISAVPTEPNFLLDCYFRLKCARPMPVYSVPGLIDHF